MKLQRFFLVAVFSLFVAAGAARAEDVTLRYELAIDHPETGTGHVKLTVSGLTSKGFRLLRSNLASPSWFDGVKVTDPAAAPGAKPLEVVPVEGGFFVTTTGGPQAVIDYTIRPGEIGSYGHVGLITLDYAALDGSFLFLVPGDEQTVKDVAFTFSVAPSWKPILAWTESQGVYHPDASFAPLRQQLSRSLICFGDFAPIAKSVGTNTVVFHVLASTPKADAEALAAKLEKAYAGIHDVIPFETGAQYRVVCLPPAPDGTGVVAGAWADGQALSLTGSYPGDEAARRIQYFSRFVMMGYFTDPPYGVNLSGEDRWLYPAVLGYAESVGTSASGTLTQTLYYSSIYAAYASQATLYYSSLDVPFSDWAKSSPATKSFLDDVKAPLLLMRLDFEIRSLTNNAVSINDFLKALYQKGHGWGSAGVLSMLQDMTNTDFSPFYDKFIRERALILPTWPEFLDIIDRQKADTGQAVAEVNGAPIYQREVDIMAESVVSEGRVTKAHDAQATAVAALIDEKLMDEALAQRKMNVVPEAFWRLRMVLPPKVMQLVIVAKRQALRDALYDEWYVQARKDASIAAKPIAPPKPAQPAKPDSGFSFETPAPKPAR